MWGTLVKSSAKEAFRQISPWVLLGVVLVASCAVGFLPVRLGDPTARHASNLIALQRFLGLLFAAIVAVPSVTPPSRFHFGAPRWGPTPWGPHLASQSLFLGQAAVLAAFFALCTLVQAGILLLTGAHEPPRSWVGTLTSTWFYGWGCLALARALAAWLSLRQTLSTFLALTLLLPILLKGGGEISAVFVSLFPGPSWLSMTGADPSMEPRRALLHATSATLFIVACNLLAAHGLARNHLGARGLDRPNSKA